MKQEQEINILIKKSFQEAENVFEIAIVKKKYLEKEGIISQLFQQISQEKDLEKKKKLGSLINNWKNELTAKVPWPASVTPKVAYFTMVRWNEIADQPLARPRRNRSHFSF